MNKQLKLNIFEKSQQILYFFFFLLIPTSIFRVNASINGYESFFLFRILLVIVFVGLVLLFLIKPAYVFERLKELKEDKLVVAFFAFWLAVGFISYFWIQDFDKYFRYNVLLALSFAYVFFLVFFIRDKKTLIIVWKLLLVTLVISLIIALLEIFFNFRLIGSKLLSEPQSVQLFVTSFFNHPNDYASYISLTLPFLLLFPLLKSYQRLKYFVFSLVALTAFVFTFTGSRVNYLSTITMLILALIISRVAKIKQTIAYASLLLVAIFSFFPSLGPSMAEGVIASVNKALSPVSYTSLKEGATLESAITGFTQGQGSVEIRKNLLLNSLQIMEENPRLVVIGLGAGQVEYYLEEFDNTEDVTSLHNWWVEVLVNHGVFIGVGYFVFFLWLLRETIKKANKTKDNFLKYFSYSMALSLVAVIFVSISPSSSVGYAPLWLTFGLALAAKNL